ncbi:MULTISPECIES: thioredoxin domain-containing protein [unclassified Roseateles]|uniref:thioredoxin domain-containing protein n=1 Tax=unclassified Roseateles TaxID=2626991 RepID=UPI0006FD34A5|nr:MULTISPECIES: thioredoxin family protein [unclassified Roseateles]KQW51970.1 thioredoxin [Pelomonas sp. Root405]KRA78203.1 thioredoxin [Pelomonas sp. Root662]
MTVHVACLCAAWCRTCESYQQVFEAACAELPQAGLRVHWIDIEDEADLIDDLDIETFPTLLIADDTRVRFAGPLTPQPETLRRVLRAHLADAQPAAVDAAFEALANRLRGR